VAAVTGCTSSGAAVQMAAENNSCK
jgi:hypothetical protein